MKKYALLTICLVLTAALLVGCGCTNKNKNNTSTSAPTVLPTNEEVWGNTTASTTQATTNATTGMDATPGNTIDRGNGALEDDAGSGMNGAGTDGTGGTNSTTGSNTTTEGTTQRRSRQGTAGGR